MLSTWPRSWFLQAPFSQLSTTVNSPAKQKPVRNRSTIQASGEMNIANSRAPAAAKAARLAKTRI